jgi:hypothetical protein
MTKKLKKGEKLDLILSELSDIKDEIKKLLKHRTVAKQGTKPRRRSAPPPRPKKLAKRTVAPTKLPGEISAPKPVLAQAAPSTQPTGRTGSH